jgi:hypothetical protein
MAPPLCTYEEAITAAAAIYSRALTRMAYQTAEQIADAAYVPGGPSREELIVLVHDLRARYRAAAA